jgi:carbon monoxide dehydrogenase subunit G
MKLEQSFTVTAPVEQVWATLIDVERVAPCLPGAEITGQSPDGGYEGTFTVKLGPATAAYRGSLKMESLDEASRTATMSAKGTDKRGQGGATASIVSTMQQEGDDTLVEVVTDFTITGRLARFGRGGMIEDISKRLMRDFAQCLQSTLAAEPAATAPAESAATPAATEDEQAEAAVASAAGTAAEAGAAAEPPAAAAEPAEPAAPLGGEEPASAAASGAGAPLPGEDAAAAEPPAPEEAAPTPLGGEEPLAAEQAAEEEAAPAASTPLGGEEPLVVPEQAVPAAREAAASQEAAPLPGEEAEPPRRAGEADPWGPLSPPAQPAAPAEEPPAQRTHSIPPPSARPTPAPAKPVKGFSLLFGVFWDRIKRFFGRLFGRGGKD